MHEQMALALICRTQNTFYDIHSQLVNATTQGTDPITSLYVCITYVDVKLVEVDKTAGGDF